MMMVIVPLLITTINTSRNVLVFAGSNRANGLPGNSHHHFRMLQHAFSPRDPLVRTDKNP